MKRKAIDEQFVKTVVDPDGICPKFKGRVKEFRENCTVALTLIKNYIDDGDVGQVFPIAETMKGPSANLGAIGLRDLFAQIESLQKSPNSVELRKLTQTAEMEYQLAIGELEALSKT